MGWFRSLFSWALPGSRDDVYSPGERTIYFFWDGQKTIRSDPLKIYKRVMEKGAELSVDIDLARSIHKDARMGHDNMIRKIRDVFRVKPLEEGGLTEQECIDLLDHFLAFCDRVKKKQNPSPTSAAATPAPSAPSSGEGPATPSFLGSGSTAEGPSTAPPEVSPTGPGSPSAA